MHYRSAIPVLVGCLFATNVLAADLMQTYMEALANDPQYASARASLMAGQEKSTQGLAKLLPNLSASGGYGRNWFEGLNYNENKYTIALTQPIFNWANYQNYETSKLQVSISEAQFAQAQQDLMMRVSQAYFDILAAEDMSSLSPRHRKLLLPSSSNWQSAVFRSEQRRLRIPMKRRPATIWLKQMKSAP